MSASYHGNYISYPALIYSMAALKRGGGSGSSMDPYEYAKSIGYEGTKEEFDKAYLLALSGGSIENILDGGIADEAIDLVWDGGLADEKLSK